MARLRYNGLVAELGGAGLTNVATAITFAAALTHSGGTNVPTITGTDYIPLTLLDSDGVPKEIVYLTAYTAAATTGTITRARESTTGVAHTAGAAIVHAPTVEDIAAAGVDYVPTLTASTTNPTLGSGSSVSGRYRLDGKFVRGWAQITFGTSGVGAGSGTYLVSLPIPQRAADSGSPVTHRIIGSAIVTDSSGGLNLLAAAITPTSNPNAVALISSASAGASSIVTNAFPMTFAASDSLYVEFHYETD